MADNNKQDKDNLIDLASERKRFQNRPSQPSARKIKGASSFAPSAKIKKATVKAGPQWYHYLQLIAFLAVMAWMMQQCQ